MNKDVITVIAVIVVVALLAVAMIYAPNILEAVLGGHRIPQH